MAMHIYSCGVCQIRRHGFSLKKENNGGEIGAFTTYLQKAIDSIEYQEINECIRLWFIRKKNDYAQIIIYSKSLILITFF